MPNRAAAAGGPLPPRALQGVALMADPPASALWTLTSYYNPAGWRSRRHNFDRFRERLQSPLLVVEHAIDGRFELGEGDADRLIQVRGGDVMWQKERLLNIGLQHLPEHCTAVAWIDADVLFAAPGWSERALAGLQSHDVLQLFSRCEHLGPDATSPADGVLLSLEGIVAQLLAAPARQDVLAQLLAEYRGLQPTLELPMTYRGYGFAWAARRSWLEAIGGLYDRCITGSGDSLLFFALQGQLPAYLGACRQSGVHREARALDHWYATLQQHRPRIGCLPDTIHHLFHGALRDRGYGTRAFLMRDLGFDYDRDLEASTEGLWQFSSTCHGAFRDAVAAYFGTRREDG